MNMQVITHTLKALVPTQGLYYFWIFILGTIYVSAAFNYGPQVHILLYFVLVYYFAYLSGSLLVDVLVKPVALLLPAMRKSLYQVILIAALLYALLGTAPILIVGPAKVFSGTGLSYMGLLLLGMSLFQVVVLVCFRLTSSMLLFSLLMCLILFSGNPYQVRTFSSFIPGEGWGLLTPMAIFIACTVATFLTTRRQDFQRSLSGKTVLTFADFGHPVRAIRAVHRMKLEALRDEPVRDMSKRPSGSLLAGLKNRELAGFLDNLAPFYHRTNWKYAFLSIVLFTVVVSISNGMAFGSINPELMLIFPLLITCEQFYTFFWRSFSPMLPVSREQHFRFSIYKCVLFWSGTVSMFLVLLLGLRGLEVSLPAPANELFQPFAQLPLKTVFWFGLAAPVVSWIFIFIRSFIGYFILIMIFAGIFAACTFTLFDAFLQLNPVLIVLLTLLLAVPFVLQSYSDCSRSDLVRSP